MQEALALFSTALVPLFVLGLALMALIRKKDGYAAFTEGAKDGFQIFLKTLPAVVGMMLAVRIFKAAGGFELLDRLFYPLLRLFGIPSALVPMLLLRPFSGSGGLALLAGIITSFGPDSYEARVAAVYFGSSETLFYVLALYFGSVGIKKSGYVVPVALAADFFGLVVCCLLC